MTGDSPGGKQGAPGVCDHEASVLLVPSSPRSVPSTRCTAMWLGGLGNTGVSPSGLSPHWRGHWSSHSSAGPQCPPAGLLSPVPLCRAGTGSSWHVPPAPRGHGKRQWENLRTGAASGWGRWWPRATVPRWSLRRAGGVPVPPATPQRELDRCHCHGDSLVVSVVVSVAVVVSVTVVAVAVRPARSRLCSSRANKQLRQRRGNLSLGW